MGLFDVCLTVTYKTSFQWKRGRTMSFFNGLQLLCTNQLTKMGFLCTSFRTIFKSNCGQVRSSPTSSRYYSCLKLI